MNIEVGERPYLSQDNAGWLINQREVQSLDDKTRRFLVQLTPPDNHSAGRHWMTYVSTYGTDHVDPYPWWLRRQWTHLDW